MRIGIISFTLAGEELNAYLVKKLESYAYETKGYHLSRKSSGKVTQVTTTLKEWTAKSFEIYEALIFIGATGIAVRAIAPFLKSKNTDPAVIVLDEKGDNVISLLSGHIGGANELTYTIAQLVEGRAIISTATDKNQVFAVDTWAKKTGLVIKEIPHIKYISAALLSGEKIGLQTSLQIVGDMPNNVAKGVIAESGLVIDIHTAQEPFKHTLHLVPPIITLGIGCRRGTPCEIIEELVLEQLSGLKIDWEAVARVTSIDLKQDEEGLRAFCQKYEKPLITYTSQALQDVPGEFTPSEFVKQITKVDNVCERAAVLGSDGGHLILRKTAKNGVTLAIAQAAYEINFNR